VLEQGIDTTTAEGRALLGMLSVLAELQRELTVANTRDGLAAARAGAMPAELPYIASKAALHELTASLAVHLAPRGITVNCVNPGPNDTGYADEHGRATVIAKNPGGRWSTPTDTARLVSWLLSDEADWITGQTIASDGGWSAARY
jgi:NAD(P)-dependent dehydrogenase (short-subunit alcohol dehydrogenase family)